MAYDRIGKTAAKLVDVPPFEIVEVTTDFILNQEVVKNNIQNVPLNLPLLDSVLYDGIINPILCRENWYPLAGSQRLRVVYEIKQRKNKDYNLNVIVHRFLKDYHNVYYLWPDTEFRSKAIAIWFQLQEVVFKSLYYQNEADKGGIEMTEYEKLGDELEWQHDRNVKRDALDTNNNLDNELKNESS